MRATRALGSSRLPAGGSAEITVPAGSSLMIDPGVEVVLAPQVDIFVEGELRAVGTVGTLDTGDLDG